MMNIAQQAVRAAADGSHWLFGRATQRMEGALHYRNLHLVKDLEPAAPFSLEQFKRAVGTVSRFGFPIAPAIGLSDAFYNHFAISPDAFVQTVGHALPHGAMISTSAADTGYWSGAVLGGGLGVIFKPLLEGFEKGTASLMTSLGNGLQRLGYRAAQVEYGPEMLARQAGAVVKDAAETAKNAAKTTLANA